MAAAHAAEQRAGPRRHQVQPQGRQRLHHQPQRRRHARRDRSGRSAAQGRSRPRGRRRATTRRSSRRWCSTTTSAACSRRTPCARSTSRAAAACSAKAPARSCSKPRTPRPSAAPAVLGEVLGGGYAAEGEGLLAIRDDGDGLARAIAQALDDAGLAPADIGMIVAHGNGTPLSDLSEAAAMRAVFGSGTRRAAGHGVQVGDRPSDRRRRHHRDGDRAGGAARAYRPGHRHACLARSGIARACASRPRRRRRAATCALILCRGFAGTNAALIVRAPSRDAAMADSADPFAGQRGQPTRCGIDSVEIARIERLLRETPAPDLARYFLAAGARRQRRRAGPRGEPRRALCRQGSLRQALSARAGAGRDRARRFFGGARQLRRAAGRLQRQGAGACSAGTACARSRCR